MRKSPKSQQITVLFSWSLPLCYKSKEKAPHSKAFLIRYHLITLILDCAEITSLQHSAFAYCPFSIPAKNARIGPA